MQETIPAAQSIGQSLATLVFLLLATQGFVVLLHSAQTLKKKNLPGNVELNGPALHQVKLRAASLAQLRVVVQLDFEFEIRS